MRLSTAIKRLERNYQLALKNDYVRDKVAWSLYLTWQQAEQARNNKEYRKKVRKEQE